MTKLKYQRHRKPEEILIDLKQISYKIRKLYQDKNKSGDIDEIKDLTIQISILEEKKDAIHWELRAAREHSLVINLHLLLGNLRVSEHQFEKRIQRVQEKIKEASEREEYEMN